MLYVWYVSMYGMCGMYGFNFPFPQCRASTFETWHQPFKPRFRDSKVCIRKPEGSNTQKEYVIKIKVCGVHIIHIYSYDVLRLVKEK